MAGDEDGNWLAAWRSGDEGAGRRLVDRHFAALYRFFRNKVGDDADDLVQETFLSLLKNEVPFRGEASFRSYVFRVARSRLYDRARAWARRGDPMDVSVTSMADLRPTPSTALGKRQEERVLLEALRRLPIEQQVLLSLFYFEEMSGSELAQSLEVPEGTVRSRLRLAKEALRVRIEEVAATRPLAESTTSHLDDWVRSMRRELLERPDPA